MTERGTRGGNDSVPQQPQTTPDAVGHASFQHSFVLQSLHNLNGNVGELTAEVRALGTRLDTLGTSLAANGAKIESLTAWRNYVVGGAGVIVAVCGLVAFAIDKFADRITLTVPAIQAPPTAPQPVQRPASN